MLLTETRLSRRGLGLINKLVMTVPQCKLKTHPSKSFQSFSQQQSQSVSGKNNHLLQT